MNTTTRFASLFSTLLLAAAPAMAGTPSGVGEFALETTTATSSKLTRQAVMAEALRSDVLDMNGEVAPSFAAVQGPRLTREAVQAMAKAAAQRDDFNSEIAM